MSYLLKAPLRTTVWMWTCLTLLRRVFMSSSSWWQRSRAERKSSCRDVRLTFRRKPADWESLDGSVGPPCVVPERRRASTGFRAHRDLTVGSVWVISPSFVWKWTKAFWSRTTSEAANTVTSMATGCGPFGLQHGIHSLDGPENDREPKAPSWVIDESASTLHWTQSHHTAHNELEVIRDTRGTVHSSQLSRVKNMFLSLKVVTLGRTSSN